MTKQKKKAPYLRAWKGHLGACVNPPPPSVSVLVFIYSVLIKNIKKIRK